MAPTSRNHPEGPSVVDYAYVTESLLEVIPEDAEIRVPVALYKRFLDATAKLAAIEAELRVRGEHPLRVTPEQEPMMRAAARPGTWIVVRAEGQPEPVNAPLKQFVELGPETATQEAPAPAPAARPKRPRLGPCEVRRGQPHHPSRFILSDSASVYFPGRVRVDGVCICGLQIADVPCPHQQQELNAAKQPSCKWCHKVLIQGAGFNDNWDNSRGVARTDMALPVPIMGAGDFDPRAKTSFRVEE